jgi:AraC family transcriptional regulator, regulatory protein of adaptative response / methylated-DNA-[protein]-cysteine methyltransferase
MIGKESNVVHNIPNSNLHQPESMCESLGSHRAFVEAANLIRRSGQRAKRWRARKLAKSHYVIAIKALLKITCLKSVDAGHAEPRYSDAMMITSTAELPPVETMIRAFYDRDPSFEGIFFTGVRTTGIFCRPTCTAKKPARENLEFFGSPTEAMLGGYRACQRCHPMDMEQRPSELIERLRTEVERAPGGHITEKELAALAIDPSTARRQFKRHYGMTFQAYHRARRMGLALHEVRQGGSISEAKIESGFESASGFREAFIRIFGEPPSVAKMRPGLFVERLETPLGAMVAVADDAGLRLLEFADRRALERELTILRRSLRTSIVPGKHRYLDTVREQISEYFSGERLEFTVPIAPMGSDFQQRTWKVLQSIPPAETRSYIWLAGQLGIPGASRAVGRANGANSLAIIIPCHRVIRADGALCGYGGGLWRKKWLLEHERKMVGRTARQAEVNAQIRA